VWVGVDRVRAAPPRPTEKHYDAFARFRAELSAKNDVWMPPPPAKKRPAEHLILSGVAHPYISLTSGIQLWKDRLASNNKLFLFSFVQHGKLTAKKWLGSIEEKKKRFEGAA